jgi:hypothetical protein
MKSVKPKPKKKIETPKPKPKKAAAPGRPEAIRFAAQLKRWRVARKFPSQKEAAEELGVSFYNYRNWEYAHRMPTTFTKDQVLAKILPDIERAKLERAARKAS